MEGGISFAYAAALGALFLWLTLRGNSQMKRTIWTLGILYTLQLTLVARLWPGVEWSWVMLGLDFVAGVIVLLRPAGKWQSVIGLSFLLQIGLHAGRALNGAFADLPLYWWGLTGLAFVQLFLVAGWWVHERFYNGHNGHRGGAHIAGASAPHRKGME